MRYIALCVLCLVVVLIVYVLFVYQRIDTVEIVYRRMLINNNNTPIVAFTYRKLAEDTYENYYLQLETLGLEKRIEPHAVTHLGFPVTSSVTHGIKRNIADGFAISGIDFPFRCPPPFVHDEQGKCILLPVCGEDDSNYYRGINYYQFVESLIEANTLTFHPRLYYDCEEPNKVLNCSVNELYVGGEKLEKPQVPCNPYDICEDRMTNTVHRYPIFPGDSLADDEFYLCTNGQSERRRCAANQEFSNIVMRCVNRNLCANQPNGTTFENSENSFIVCNNGTEAVVNCLTRVLLSDVSRQLECRNMRCDTRVPRMLSLNKYFRIPISVVWCAETNNVLIETTCDPLVVLKQDDPSVLQNTNFTLGSLTKRFEDFDVPTKILIGLECVDFDMNLHRAYVLTTISDGSHNEYLPLLPYDVFTGNLSYEGGFYRDRLSIKDADNNNNIVGASSGFANFTEIYNYNIMELNGNVVLQGDVDGVLYGVVVTFETLNNRSNESLRKGFKLGVPIQHTTEYFNAYAEQFGPFDEAHAAEAMTLWPNLDVSYANMNLFAFKVFQQIDDDIFEIVIWSKFGAVLAQVTKNGGVSYIDGEFVHNHLPNNLLTPYANPFVGIVSNISNDAVFTYHHEPIFSMYFVITEIKSPILALSKTYDELFNVPDSYVYRNPIDVSQWLR